MSTRELNATAASLLGFLHEGPKTGWDLAATAQRVIGGFWSLTQSQIYRELAAMAAAGLIEAGERGPRERQPYTLTPAGRAAFAKWIERDPGAETIRFPMLLSLAFGRFLPPERIEAIIAVHRATHAERLERYERRRDELRQSGATEHDRFSLATLAFGLHYERAVMAWFDELPELIGGISSGESARSDDAVGSIDWEIEE